VKPRRFWTRAEEQLLKQLYPLTPMPKLKRRFRSDSGRIYAKASQLGLHRSPAFFANAKASGRFDKLTKSGVRHRFPKGHVPANKGVKRPPGWAPGRMRETQFKKGHFPANRDPDYYVLGALRINADGYIDMRVSFEPGAKGWRTLHRILWEDAHGPVPPKHCLIFKDGDRLNVELANLVLISQRDNMRRNSVHNLPKELAQVLQLNGALKRKINRRLQGAGDQSRRPQ